MTKLGSSETRELRFGGKHGIKNTGWFGPQRGHSGHTSTEISLGDGEKELYPAMTPNMSGLQLKKLLSLDLSKDKIPADIQDTARQWRDYRAAQGKSPFWESGDQVYPKPPIPLSDSGMYRNK